MTISEVWKPTTKYNKSKTYLLPLLTNAIEVNFTHLIINCFIKFNKNIGKIEYPFAILYDTTGFDGFSEFDEYDLYLMGHPLFFKSYIVNDDFKLYVFNFPEEFQRDYNMFKEGKYSKFGNEAKALIVSYSAVEYKYPPLIQDISGVLWKHASRKKKIEMDLGVTLPPETELASIIVYEDETFKFKDAE